LGVRLLKIGIFWHKIGPKTVRSGKYFEISPNSISNLSATNEFGIEIDPIMSPLCVKQRDFFGYDTG
jgi:hypothetical protein